MRKLSLPLLLLMAVAILAFVACGEKPGKLEPRQGEKKQPAQSSNSGDSIANAKDSGLDLAQDLAQQLQDIKFSKSRGEKLQWKLEAKAVEQVAEGPITLESVKITYYSDEGKAMHLIADTGSYDASANDVTFQGNVVIRTSDGAVIETDAIRWDQELQALTGEGEVTILRGDSQINGRGFELLAEQESFKLHHVDGIIRKGDVNR
jgi:LPS export ABC transporter protein LptC